MGFGHDGKNSRLLFLSSKQRHCRSLIFETDMRGMRDKRARPIKKEAEDSFYVTDIYAHDDDDGNVWLKLCVMLLD